MLVALATRKRVVFPVGSPDLTGSGTKLHGQCDPTYSSESLFSGLVCDDRAGQAFGQADSEQRSSRETDRSGVLFLPEPEYRAFAANVSGDLVKFCLPRCWESSSSQLSH